MKTIVSLDYELFFGSWHGTQNKCLFEPCEALLRVMNRAGGKAAFFVDAGYLCKLDEYRRKIPAVQREADSVVRHLDDLVSDGHELHLHIHPHWEDTYRNGNGWQFDMTRYSLHKFDEGKILDIVKRYQAAVGQIAGSENVFCYRAGGWVIQPFFVLAPALRECGIWLDSTVFPGGLATDSTQTFDFSSAPDKDYWRFGVNPVIEDSNGWFLEIPISAVSLSPWSYWSLAISKFVGGLQHRTWGDGTAIRLGKTDLLRKLLMRTVSTASIDGPKAGWLEQIRSYHAETRRDLLVLIGHPKSLTPYSIARLDQFFRERPEIEITGYADYKHLRIDHQR